MTKHEALDNKCRLCHMNTPRVPADFSGRKDHLRPYHFLVCSPCLKKEKGRIHSNNSTKRVRRKYRPNLLYSDWMELLVQANFCCTNCGQTGRSKLTLDHKVSLGKGGTNTIGNVQILCRTCHDQKDKILPDPLRFIKTPYRKFRRWVFKTSGIQLPYPAFLKGNRYTK